MFFVFTSLLNNRERFYCVLNEGTEVRVVIVEIDVGLWERYSIHNARAKPIEAVSGEKLCDDVLELSLMVASAADIVVTAQTDGVKIRDENRCTLSWVS